MERVVGERIVRGADQAMKPAHDPAIELAPFAHGDRGTRLPTVDRRVGDEEAVAVPERQDLAAHLAVDAAFGALPSLR